MKLGSILGCLKMGCVESKDDFNLPDNVFKMTSPVLKEISRDSIEQVTTHNPQSPGDWFVQITDEEMIILHGKTIIQRYPLRYLRRYGVKDQTFKFEAGRKCPTGEGHHYFLCPQAERLYSCVIDHTKLNSQSDDTVSHMSQDGNLPSLTNLALNRNARISSTTSNGPLSPISPLTFNDPPPLPPPNPPPEYMNNAIYSEQDRFFNNNQSSVSYTNVDLGYQSLQSPTISSCFDLSDTDTEAYASLLNKNDTRHQYSNCHGIDSETGDVFTTTTPGSSSGYSGKSLPPPLNLKSDLSLTYLVLDLDNNNNNNKSPTQQNSPQPFISQLPTTATAATQQQLQPPPESPTVVSTSDIKQLKGYAIIDFDKTVALSQAVNGYKSDDMKDCSRRTRHNSSI